MAIKILYIRIEIVSIVSILSIVVIGVSPLIIIQVVASILNIAHLLVG